MQVGDFVKTVEGWSAIDYYGVVIGMEASSSHARVLLTKATSLGEKTYWFPVQKIEVINAGR